MTDPRIIACDAACRVRMGKLTLTLLGCLVLVWGAFCIYDCLKRVVKDGKETDQKG